MPDEVTIFAIAGSIRHDSYNRAALRAATELTPEGMILDVYEDLAKIPPFNQDLESSPPAEVSDLKARVRESSGVLFVTPENNYGVPGVLKNAIDWASRPYGDSAWEGKPVAVMGASISMIGSARAQYQLRQSFVFLNMYPINRPEVMIANAPEQFDGQGRLTNEMSRDLISQLLGALYDVARQYEDHTDALPFPGFRPSGVAPRKA